MITGFTNLRCGLLGETLGHTVSPLLHHTIADYEYRLFEVPKDGLDAFMRSDAFDCLNVTIPHKINVLPYLSDVTPTAAQAGAVNCIKRRDGKLFGHNSDVFGFSYLLDSAGVNVAGKKVMILGSGGASRAVSLAVKTKGAKEIVTVSRTGNVRYDDLSRHRDTDILVNATPVGMFPHGDGIPPVSLDDFPGLTFVADVIYRPFRTRFLSEAEKRGIKTANGLLMLAAQAKEAAEFFTGVPVPEEEIGKAAAIVKNALQNVVLVGMPGCGKTTVGRAVAALTGKRFFDVDEEIEKEFGRSPEEIIRKDGEAAFRKAEAAVMAKLSENFGCVIALGGGGVLHEKETEALSRNAAVVYLERALSDCPTEGRPISQSKDPVLLYRERAPYYQKYADFTTDNDGVKTTAERIVKELSK